MSYIVSLYIPKVYTVTNMLRPELGNPALANKGHFSVCQQLILLYELGYFIARLYEIIYCFFNFSFPFDFISMTSHEATGSTFRRVI